MTLTHDDVKNIISIIDSAEQLEELELGWGDFRIHVWRARGASRIPQPSVQLDPSSGLAAAAPATGAGPRRRTTVSDSPRPAVESAVAPDETAALAPDETAIRAPMLGTFYRTASPGGAPFVEVGQSVGAGDTVCLIEVMKLFNSVSAGVDGTVTRILRENGALVEFDEPLIIIRAHGG